MSKAKTIRFASGSPNAPFSGVWRLVVNKNDVYLGSSKSAMSIFKFSLHESGVWVMAATQQSQATFENGNRRAKSWSRPLEHSLGVTRGPSIFVPHTSLGSRPLEPNEGNKNIYWYKSPQAGETVEFSLYFVKPNTPTKWNANETVVGELPLANGSHVVLLASKEKESSKDFQATCERLLRENRFQMSNPSDFLGGSFLWITQSRDNREIPIIVDLPVAIDPQETTTQ
jgi:hypothetical protein